MDSLTLRNLRRWKALSIALSIAVLVLIVATRLEAPRYALGQIPDSGAQRDKMITELETANKKLADIADLLKEIRDQRVEKPKPEPRK